MINIIKSLIIVIAIAGTVAAIIDLKYNNFLQAFTVTIAVQIIGYNLLKKLQSVHLNIKNKELQILEAETLKDAGVSVQCAYCGSSNLIPVTFQGDNSFSCADCEKVNAVYINITSAQKTDSTINSSVNVNVFDDNIEMVKSKIKNNDE